MVYKIVDHYSVEDIPINYLCPNCNNFCSTIFRSNCNYHKTFCDYCEEVIIFDVVVCPSCVSSKSVFELAPSLYFCERCQIVFERDENVMGECKRVVP